MVYNPSPQGEIDVRLATGNILPEDYPDTEIVKKLNQLIQRFSSVSEGI